MTDGPRRVLIVEDEIFVAMLLEDMLAELGYEVAGIASRVDSALPMVDTLDFEFAILDVNLAGEPSFPVADAVARKGRPYLFATAYGRRGVIPAHAHCAVISKPFSTADLQSAIVITLQKA